MHVTHIEASTLTRETTRAQGREAALMTNFCQGIGLIHKLGELATAKELFHSSDNRADIDQRIGRRLTRLLNAHTLFNDALHAQQTDAELTLDQLSHTAHTAVAQVVDVILAAMPIVQRDQPTQNIDQ